jgi:hypothetical protein
MKHRRLQFRPDRRSAPILVNVAEIARRITPDLIPLGIAAARLVAGCCDGAQRKDSVGFSKTDCSIGHRLACISKSASRHRAAVGFIIAFRYRKQLGQVDAHLVEVAKAMVFGLPLQLRLENLN